MSTSEFDDAFTAFWSGYLRRQKKQQARDAFAWAMKKHNGDGELLTKILDTLAWQRALTPEWKYWTTPDKWLLGCRWEDERPITEGEQAEMEQFNAWQKAYAHDPVTKTITFDVFQRFQRHQRRAG